MKVKVKTVKQEVFEVELQAGMKVSDVKAAIETQVDAEKFQRDLLTIVCKGKRWTDDNASLEDMGVEESSVIVVVVKKAPPKPAPADAAAPAPAPEPKPVEAAPAAAPAEPAPAAASAEGGEAPPAGPASAFVTGSDLQSSIKAIMEMGFSEADVKRAMRAAFNNPERAVEYLMTGIPAGLEPPTAPAGGDAPAPEQLPPGIPAAGAPAAPAAAAGAPAAQNPAATGPNAAPLDMWGAGGAGAAAAAGGAAGAGGMANVLEALQSNPQMQQRLQQLVQNDPNTMLSLVQELARHNPQLLSALQSNPQAALGALLGGAAEPQGEQVQLDLSEADEAAITHLEALGFARVACIQAYIACEKNEELAANYLLENGTEEDMQ